MSCTTKKTMDLSSMTREELEAYAMQVSSEKEELAAVDRQIKIFLKRVKESD